MDINLKDSLALSSHEQINTICQPIFSLFSINFFRYLRVFPDGSRIHLCNNPNWTEHFYQKAFYNIAWFDANRVEVQKNIETLWDERALRDDNIVGIEARTHFNMYHGISIVRPGIRYCEIFDFATEESNTKINDII